MVATVHGQDTTVKIPDPGGKTETKKDHIRRVRGVVSLRLHYPSPRPSQHPHREGPPGPLVHPVGKRAPGHTQLSKHRRTLPRRPTEDACHGDYWGICRT